MRQPTRLSFAFSPLEPETQQRMKALFSAFLIWAQIINFVFGAWFILLGSAEALSLTLNLVVGGFMLGLYLLLWRGHLRLVGWLLPASLSTAITMTLIIYGSVQNSSLMAYFLILALIALSLGEIATLVSAGLMVLVVAGIYLGEVNGLIHPMPRTTGALDIAIFVGALSIMALLLRVAIRQINQGFKRAREREAQLDALNAELEQRVADRTAQWEVANHELQMTQSRLQYLISSTPSVIYSLKASEPWNVTYISHNISIQLGYEPVDCLEDLTFWRSHIHPEDAPRVLDEFPSLLQKGYYAIEYRFQHKNGTYRWMRDDTKLIHDPTGAPLEIIGSWTDITEWKKGEIALTEERALLRTLIDHLPDFIYVKDTASRLLLTNLANAQTMGITPEAGLGKTDFDFYPREFAEKFFADDQAVIQSGQAISNKEETVLNAHGYLRWVLTSKIPLQNQDGEIIGLVGIGHDITERKQAEHALRRSEALMNTTNQIARIGGWELDLRTNELYWTDTVKDIHEVPLDYVPNLTEGINFYAPDSRSAIRTAIDCAMTGQPYDLELQIITAKDHLCWVRAMGHPIFENGQVVKLLGIFQDITPRKYAELALQERETLYRALFEQSNDGVILNDVATNKVIAANQAIADMLHCEVNDIVGTWATDDVVPEELPDAQERWRRTLAEGHLPPYERRLITHDNRVRDFEISTSAIYDTLGTPRFVQAVLRDITERKQAEQQIQAALQEKEILLKEIHHRVKNNLQVISSLLYLQSQKIKDERLLELFRESQNRVAAMALVHEQLYQSNSFARIDFGDYARALIHSLFESYGVEERQITLAVETDGSTLDVHTAIPCGLLISEMVSNALKYAFPEAQRGQITITFHAEGNTYHLWVNDNGVGIPSDSLIRPGSLGLQLISRLVAQIGGKLERTGPPGTAHHIQFPMQGKESS